MVKHSPPSVLVLDDSADLCAAMSQLIELKLGAHCLCANDVDSLMTQRDLALLTKIAFLDINLGAGRQNGVDALNWLRLQGYAGHVYFFSGHARHSPFLNDIEKTGVRILSKPLPTKDLLDLVDQALKSPSGAPE